MKLLLTGANGFVGGHLKAAALAAGHEVVEANRGVCDFESGESAVREAMRAALREIRPEAVIHLAGPPPTADAERCRRLCYDCTRGLLAALDSLTEPIPLVAAGSATEIGTFASPRPCVDESVEANPNSPYGEWKLRQSELVLEWGGTAMRLFNSTGPGQGTTVVAGRIVRQLAAGAERLAIREVASVRDFLDVRDAARAFLLALECDPGRYNICSGRPVSIGELVQIALVAAGSPDLDVEVEMPDHAGNFVCGSPAKLERAGWERRFTLEETIADSIEFARIA